MDPLIMASLCISILYFLLTYEIKITPKLAISAPVPNIFKCGACRKSFKELISLEKCGHKLCKVCLEGLIKESPVTWQDQNGTQFKISSCSECKEFFRVGGHKIFWKYDLFLFIDYDIDKSFDFLLYTLLRKPYRVTNFEIWRVSIFRLRYCLIFWFFQKRCAIAVTSWCHGFS